MAQLPFSVFLNGKLLQTITLIGKDTEWRTYELVSEDVNSDSCFLKLYFSLGGIEISRVDVRLQ